MEQSNVVMHEIEDIWYFFVSMATNLIFGCVAVGIVTYMIFSSW